MPISPLRAYEQHVAALLSGDLDAVVAGYAPDAVLVDTGRIGRGREHVRAVFAETLRAAGALEPHVEVLSEGDVVFVSWHAEQDGARPLVGADTFVFADGLITAHTGFVAAGAPTDGLATS